jgi:hypothetical protein
MITLINGVDYFIFVRQKDSVIWNGQTNGSFMCGFAALLATDIVIVSADMLIQHN